jgi:DNA-directed RNA polymerase specialized sigma24 family protein
MIEDKLLILRFKQGQREALRRIYDKFKISLLKLATELLGGALEAEDVVHDVFVSFAQSADRLKLTGSFRRSNSRTTTPAFSSK